MTKPAILHICLSHGWGGLEMYPIRVGQEFIDRGYEVYGLCIENTQVSEGMKKAGLVTFEVKSKSTLAAFQIRKLNKWLVKHNVSIIHSHKSGDILISALLNALTPRKSFFTEHMGVTRPKKSYYHKWAYKHITQVFSISDETYKRNVDSLPVPSHKITRLWLGTHIPQEQDFVFEKTKAIRLELNINESAFLIGNVGRLCLGKGQRELLEAFGLLKDKYPQIHLALVGGLDVSEGADNEFVDELKCRVTELDLIQRVHFTGFRKDTYHMLSAMDVVCLPNHNEAFGLTAIEAMAAKKAIVGASTGAFPEILGGTALLANPLEPFEIAKKIELYLENQHLKNEKENLAFQRAREEFSMGRHIKKLSDYYHDLAINTSPSILFRLRNKFRVSGEHHISIADSAKVRGSKIIIKGVNNTLIIEDGVNIRDSQIEVDGNNCVLKIGKNTVIGHCCYLSSRENGTKLNIGQNCMLSRNVKIMTSDGHPIFQGSKRINLAKDIDIGCHVWLADGVTVLKGVVIGSSSVIGINSTLTKSMPGASIAVGNPAKVVCNDVKWKNELTF